jgi:hypothetical protein
VQLLLGCIVFSTAYAVLYLAAMYFDLALVTYYPAAKRFYPLVPATPQARGLAMFWYTATSSLATQRQDGGAA